MTIPFISTANNIKEMYAGNNNRVTNAFSLGLSDKNELELVHFIVTRC